jgi:transmembrane sensor
MKQENKHKSNQKQEGLNNEILSRMEIPFKRDKEDVWKSIDAKMNEPADAPGVSSRRIPLYLYVAASFIVLVAVATLFLRSYSYTEFTGTEISSIVLPDGSTIEAKDNTEISYHPYWWWMKREVMLEGEGYFEVEKGKTFAVMSAKGITKVLGTTFTVYSRSEQYKVSCYSGSVNVSSVYDTVSATLIANEEMLIDENGNFNIRLISEDEISDPIDKEYYFIFNSTSIQEVFRQIGSYYNVRINFSSELDHDFSGNLKRDLSVQNVLDAVCIPFEIDYAQNSETEFTIDQ